MSSLDAPGTRRSISDQVNNPSPIITDAVDAAGAGVQTTPDATAAQTTPERSRIPVHERAIPGNGGWVEKMWTKADLYVTQKRGMQAATYSIPALRAQSAERTKQIADLNVQAKEGARNRLRNDSRKASREIQRLQRSARNAGVIQNFINKQKIRFVIGPQEAVRRAKAAWVGSGLERAKTKQERAQTKLEGMEAARQEKMRPFMEKLDSQLGRIDPLLNDVNGDVTRRENRMREASSRASTLRAQCEAYEAELEASNMSDAEYQRATQALTALWDHAHDAQAIVEDMRPEYETVCAHRNRTHNAYQAILVARRQIEAGHNETTTSGGEALPTEQAHLERTRAAHSAARSEFNEAEDNDRSFESVMHAFRERRAEVNRNTEVPKSDLVGAWNRFVYGSAQIGNISDMARDLETTDAARTNPDLLRRIAGRDAIQISDFEQFILVAYTNDVTFTRRLDRVMGSGETPREYMARFVAQLDTEHLND